MKKTLRMVGIVLATLLALRVGLAFVWPTINDVSTGGTPEYPDIQAQRFEQAPQKVFESALATAQASGWQLTAQDAVKGEIQAVATTRLWKFKDDVTITVTADGTGSIVNLRSRSRVGVGDLGANARRIRQFQADLAARLR